jgi:putative ABC transport system permease protein
MSRVFSLGLRASATAQKRRAEAPNPRGTPRLPATLSLREWSAHPWRYVMIVLTLSLGVALAWAVHLINSAALTEFASAVRATQGEPDAVLRHASGARGVEAALDDRWLDRVAAHPSVVQALGVVEVDTLWDRGEGSKALPVRVLGVDAFTAAALAPGLVPVLSAEGSGGTGSNNSARADPLLMLDETSVFLNAAARDAMQVKDGQRVRLRSGDGWRVKVIRGSVAAGGGPALVMDVAAAQDDFAHGGKLTRIDVRLKAGTSAQALEAPAQARWSRPDDGAQRVSNLSRAYRVNLMVLALVALVVGAFMAYAVVALAVAQRTPAFALLGVLGLTAGERARLVLRECAALGLVGSVLGLVLGWAFARWALSQLGGDLGGGYFPGVKPTLSVSPWAALVMLVLGVAAALAGGWFPSRQAQRLRPALALKGLGGHAGQATRPWLAAGLLGLALALTWVPALDGVPLAAYASVAVLLFAGVAWVPWVVGVLLATWPTPRSAVALLGVRRAQFHRHTAVAVVAGVVASLALSVALVVMVGSFRVSVTQWLDQVLPADLYVRAAAGAGAEGITLDPGLAAKAAALLGVRRAEASRSRSLLLSPARPPVALVANATARESLPFTGRVLPPREGEVGVYVSEAVVQLHGARLGQTLTLPLPRRDGQATTTVRVLGVWRDFARQFGAIAMAQSDYQRLTGDGELNDMALWLEPQADVAAVQAALRKLTDVELGFATTAQLRQLSLTIFDRSFAVTRYLQVVAIVIGLMGVAAGLSAQVLARRKEFGLMTHLGFTRAQVVRMVVAEVLAWLVAGVLVGVALGLAIGVVLVHVVNPQSFNWTMQMHVQWVALLALALGVVAAGCATAWITARMATATPAVQAVRQDW